MRSPTFRRLILLPVFAMFWAWELDTSDALAEPATDQELPADLTEVGIERLLNFDLVVTSPGKKEEIVANTASAVYVLTTEDIRRSGATHIAEVLRLVPGVNVGRVAANKWAISVRGFNQVFADKLLVLVDGVSIFSPTINGVYWETNEFPLEDVERIEVIRGPGAALWGSNAVNGVINVITKHTSETIGSRAMVGGGTHEHFLASAAHGGEIGELGTYRLYLRQANRGENELASGGGAEDDWQVSTGGLRADLAPSDSDTVTLQGRGQYSKDAIQTTAEPSLSPPFIDNETYSGENRWHSATASALWNHDFSDTAEIETLASYRYLEQESALVTFDYNIYDLDLQYRLQSIDRHDLIVGAKYELFRFHADRGFPQDFEPNERSIDLYTFFVQDDIELLRDRLFLTLGSKFELNVHTEFEVMPSVRAIYIPSPQRSVWAAVSRAVALPSLVFEDITVPAAAFPVDESTVGLAALRGNRDIDSQKVVTYELGYRSEITKSWSWEVATFYSDYSDVQSVENGDPQPFVPFGADQAVLLFPLNFDNRFTVDSFGGELSTEFRPAEQWRLIGGYSFLQINVAINDSSDAGGEQAFLEEASPEHQFFLRSLWDVTPRVEFDGTLRYVDRLSEGDIDSYVELDLHLGWRATDRIRIELIGTNLLEDSHEEYLGNLFGPPLIEIERSLYARATLEF
ncbi:MAG: TonB-dependent receptor [Bdellovibrionales bacterium]|nr:TonB-dependent receptor [Bdellovibrionales bacterium]